MTNINNNITPNRGLNFILHGGKRKQPKFFHIIYEKMVRFLKTEATIHFDFSITLRKIQ
jgi:hypothetical protein